ncbi:PIR protein [Plasmodium brasilianum]|uniref:PIR protein n=1 Tax=Plasmodium brasilianum TaxID=5824 RepID=A0ACB9YEL2_PLABR|nr:PIR protein [Plasmodium brasilianum]
MSFESDNFVESFHKFEEEFSRLASDSEDNDDNNYNKDSLIKEFKEHILEYYCVFQQDTNKIDPDIFKNLTDLYNFYRHFNNIKVQKDKAIRDNCERVTKYYEFYFNHKKERKLKKSD